MKVAVIGANGQLGADVFQAFENNGDTVTALNHDVVDISDFNDLQEQLENLKPALVINTAARHNVDQCEQDPARSFAVNGIGARNLALLSNETDYVLMHISTDYVFDGAKKAPYTESDSPVPLNVYGNTKLAGEYFVRTVAERYFVARLSGIYGVNPCRAKGGLNFVKLMLKLANERDEVRVVDDEVLTPTFTEDIAQQLVKLATTQAFGLYHVTAQGECSWYEFAEKVFELSKAEVTLKRASPGEFPMKVPRPDYSVLENKGLKNLNIDIMPHWKDGLQRYLHKLGYQ